MPTAQLTRFIDVPVEFVGDCGVDMLEVPPGHMPPLHVHHSHDELFYVLNGELSLLMPGRELRVKAGDTVRAPMGVPHVYRVEGDRPARWIVWSEPRGFEKQRIFHFYQLESWQTLNLFDCFQSQCGCCTTTDRATEFSE